MYTKYPRTFHVPWSQTVTDDDKKLSNMDHFEGQQVVVTEKMDGENTTIYHNGYVHARSLSSDYHPSRTWVKQLAAKIAFQIPKNWRLCGENMFAKHSLAYNDLPGYFLLFAIYDENNTCLSWEDTVSYANLLQIPLVPSIYQGIYDQEKIIDAYKGQSIYGKEAEGYVIRLQSSFDYQDFKTSVAKMVRENHVQTNKHWSQQSIVKNQLL